MATWWPKPRLPQWNMTTTWLGMVMPKARPVPRRRCSPAGHLDLQVVVAGAEGADLVVAALDGLLADLGGIGAGEAAALLGQLQVLLPAVALAPRTSGAPCSTTWRNSSCESLTKPGAADPGRDALEEPVDQLAGGAASPPS